MITESQFEDLLALSHELPGIEFKGPSTRSENPLFGRVVRAAIGMANRRDGGIVIVGIEEQQNHTLVPKGLSEGQLATWRYEDVAGSIASYVDPPIVFDLDVYESKNMKFVVLQIQEFTTIPIICKKEYRDDSNPHMPIAQRKFVLRKGSIYVRSRHKPETIEISSAEDTRALLELAVEKGVQKFVTQAQRTGMSLSTIELPSDQKRFEQQRQSFTSQLPEQVMPGGYLQTIIRPVIFAKERLEYTSLSTLIEKTTVSRQGYEFPQVDGSKKFNKQIDSIGQSLDQVLFPEVWTFYQSGQFIDIGALDKQNYTQPSLNEKIHILTITDEQNQQQETLKLSVQDIIYRLSIVFEFASRLAQHDIYIEDGEIYIEILIKGLKSRQLSFEYIHRLWMSARIYQADLDEFPYSQVFSRSELIIRPRELALDVAKRLFDRFGWTPTLQLLQNIQSLL